MSLASSLVRVSPMCDMGHVCGLGEAVTASQTQREGGNNSSDTFMPHYFLLCSPGGEDN